MRTIIIALIATVLLSGCKSADNLSKAEVATLITEKVAKPGYTFVPNSAIPMQGRMVNLDRSYSLRVSKDTVEAYLPYFGRAYTAPMPGAEGGIKFRSTDFNYSTSGKKNGQWSISIEVKDAPSHPKLFLSIGDSGYTTLSVQETNRQAISFYGKIE